MLELTETYSWDRENFKEAYKKVVQEDFINHYVRQEKWNRSKKFCAKMFCEHDADIFRCSLFVFNKIGDLISKNKLFEEKPDEFYFNSRIGNIKWINNTTVAHLSKDGHELARFDVGDLMASK